MKILFFVLSLFFLRSVFSQFTLYKGDNSIEISGCLTSFYNYRFYPTSTSDFKKNRFGLRDAQLQFEGRIGKKYEYELQLDFADIFSKIEDVENPGLMDANFTYKIFSGFSTKIGFQKLPYSRSSLVPFVYSPFFQRAEMIRGELFSRRDAGITFQYTFMKQLINLYGGIYSGLGESILIGDNDRSGKSEFLGRIDISFPSRFRYRELDMNHSAIPMFSLGGNYRYSEKGTSLGQDFQIKTLDGYKSLYGFDFAMQFKGFSAQIEAHQMYGVPKNPSYLQGLNTRYFKAGGILAQVNYYFKKIKSSFSVRYDEFNPSDLILGDTQKSISYGFNYFLDGTNSIIRIQYWQRLKQDITNSKWTDDQIRIGWTLLLN
jgi:hypothetical protein